jgi:peroxiredoxin
MPGDSTSSILVAALLALLLASQLALWAVLYQVVKQQGRLLLRLDDLKAPATELPVVPAQPPGPAVGAPVAPFELPDLSGRQLALEAFRGQRVLLVHWSPGCGFCDLIAPDLALHYGRLREQGVQLVLVSSGDPVANLQLAQRHRLDCPIVLQPQGTVIDVFRRQGTPVACLVDAEGKVAAPLAVGAEAVPALVRELISVPQKRRLPGRERPLSESRIVRDGLKAGTPAPHFTLPDIRGHQVSLGDFIGRPLVLVFSDPHCGPCDALAPQLAQVENVQLVMISRGDVEDTRRKAEQYGFDFPVLVQERWEISRAFGIFATPVAFLVGADGVIQRNVAQGADAILSLINDVRKEQRDGLAVR